MKNVIKLACVFIIMQTSVFGQEILKDANAVTKHADKVIHQIEKMNISEAFAELKVYWPLPENEISSLESQTLRQLNVATDRFGKIIGSSFIIEEKVADFLVRRIYVIRYEKHLIRVMFVYYKNDEGWILNAFNWDDKADDLFE
jgi:hypothetical protein